MADLNAKQEQFCLEYLKDFNGAQAAIRAGYSEKTARAIASENLTKPYIAERIQELMDEMIGDKNKIIFENIRFWVSMRDDAEVKEADRLKASELLGRYAAMFTERVEQTGTLTVNFHPLADEANQ